MSSLAFDQTEMQAALESTHFQIHSQFGGRFVEGSSQRSFFPSSSPFHTLSTYIHNHYYYIAVPQPSSHLHVYLRPDRQFLRHPTNSITFHSHLGNIYCSACLLFLKCIYRGESRTRLKKYLPVHVKALEAESS